MPVRRDGAGLGQFVATRNKMRVVFEATRNQQALEWLEENDHAWLERYLYNQARTNRRSYQPIGYY